MATKKSKKIRLLENSTILFFILGAILGVGQAFFIHEIQVIDREKIRVVPAGYATCMAMMPECGVCLHETVGDVCVNTYTKIVRGYPLYAAGSGGEYKTNQPLETVHFINFIIFLLPATLLLMMAKYENNRTQHTAKK